MRDITGTHVHYFYICKRKLWLFDKNICFERENERVLEGKYLHSEHFNKDSLKEFSIDSIKIDSIDGKYIKEIKISSKMEEAHIMQVLYYLYVLNERGIDKKATINYIKEKKVVEVELTTDNKLQLIKDLEEINNILKNNKMPNKPSTKKVCQKCAYYEFCFSGEE